LQSEGELSIASTGKDPQSGRLETREYHVQGPVMIFSTTTSIEIDEELQNRCIILTVNESREQTRAIHRQQRESRTLEGLFARREKPLILALHRNAQRLLHPLPVLNPYARKLTFLDDKTRTRRDHEKYLGLIDTIALLHQYQRSVRKVDSGTNHSSLSYIEVQLSDIEIANQLANEVLGRSLDELPPQTRALLLIIHQFVTEESQRLNMDKNDFRFSRRQIREYSGWGNTQVKIHFQRLEEMEYLIIHKGGRSQTLTYELLYNGEGQQCEKFLMGLIDTEKLKSSLAAKEKKAGFMLSNSNLPIPSLDPAEYDANRSGQIENLSASSRGQVATRSGSSRAVKKTVNSPQALLDLSLASFLPENAYIEQKNNESQGSHSHTLIPFAAKEKAADCVCFGDEPVIIPLLASSAVRFSLEVCK
jgi:hypothetical protein